VTGRPLFLDFGGTLVRSLGDGFAVWHAVLDSHGYLLDRAEFEPAWTRVYAELGACDVRYLGRTGAYWRAFEGRVLEELRVEADLETVKAELREAFVSAAWHPPFPETEEVLTELRRRGHRLHLVSNNTEELLVTLRKLGWADWFDSVSFSQEVGAEKPDPRVFALALERARCKPAEATHIGDSWASDVVGADRAGIPPIWLNREGGPFPGGCPVIPSLRELLDLF
jgi:HAD superfamily hydrolase (TIGR01549 family)